MPTMIDPPSGWLYGFPKLIPENRKKDATVWLVEQGYPQNLIDELGENFICRYWTPEKAIIKFNGGDLALLCSGCSSIVKTGVDFTQDELDFALTKGKHLDPLYCDKCKNKNL